ncbi:cryptochrome/photolyase family protein [Candidatus Bandiella numerosa]|uniref:cryptochrome/photolyase family protein n=1 Tax=Candidatus Bandiella numerosa TaxID=2570586 RepID=UPI001F49058C|nr:deoxyribodipyrimidine photo-lyase [Candidatus Bandiella numerosa]
MKEKTVIHWFKQDLRLHDNPSLYSSCKTGRIIPIYIFDTYNPKQYQIGGASSWWLHHSLISLQKSLSGNLCLFLGNPKDILLYLIDKYNVCSVHWNRCYASWKIERDSDIEKFLTSKGVEVKTYNASLLWEPWETLKQDGTPYKVFTPFYKSGCLLNGVSPRKPIPAPVKIEFFFKDNEYNNIEKLNLLPNLAWHKKLSKHWDIGEKNAISKLADFIESSLQNYKEGRNYPGENFASRLSPHIHFGEISPNFIWNKINSIESDENTQHFFSELGWREFSYYLLYHFPFLPKKNLQKNFDKFPWEKNEKYLDCWQKGITGYPIVDAGMRQLWEEGYMHNRVRMIVGSFLVKNLLLHWHHGQRWFWDCLVDADLANNSAGWQWIAGCGADAAPYFRIFNPVTQGHKFDAQGKYTRKYVPELNNLPNKYLFSPWEAPNNILKEAGVVLGENYPYPIVNLQESRNLALEAYDKIKLKNNINNGDSIVL